MSIAMLQSAAPRGIDVVFDPVGGTPLNEALKCVRWSAHILFIGFASGHIPKVRNLLMMLPTEVDVNDNYYLFHALRCNAAILLSLFNKRRSFV